MCVGTRESDARGGRPAGLLLAAVLMAGGTANAVPRGEVVEIPPPTPRQLEEQRLQMGQDMTAWLSRMVGRFKVTGVMMGVLPLTGRVDCIAVGKSPGVHCVLNVTPGRNVEPAPTSVLYGLAPQAATIRYMRLNTNGLANDGPARLKNDTVIMYCESATGVLMSCGAELRVRSPPGARYIQMTMYAGPTVSFNFDMRRVAPDQWKDEMHAPRAPPADAAARP